MITATRGQAHETEDGQLEVTFVVHRHCKAEFFEAFGSPGSWASLAPAEKPPTQGAVTEGKDDSKVAQPTTPGSERARRLVTHPYFQAFAATRSGAHGDYDAARVAYTYLTAKSMGIGNIYSPEAFDKLMADYTSYCQTKGWSPDEN